MVMLTARDFQQDVNAAQRAAETEPVCITDGGRPAYVFMSIAEYRRLTRRDNEDFLAALSMDDDEDIEFDRMDYRLREDRVGQDYFE